MCEFALKCVTISQAEMGLQVAAAVQFGLITCYAFQEARLAER